jgi:plastocyanin
MEAYTMRILYSLSVSLGLTLACAAVQAQVMVDVHSFAFETKSNVPGMGTNMTTIHPGDTVRWSWSNGLHNVTSDTGAWTSSGNQVSPFTFDVTFFDVGTFPYHCSLHQNLGMVGTIIVQGSKISGQINLQSAVNAAQPITFEFRGGAGVFTRTITLAADGSYSLSMPPNATSLAIKGSKWLRKVITVDPSAGDATGVNVTLLPGDINNDNTVNIADLGMLADTFNLTPSSPKWNANADLNCDGVVNILDLGLLADNFGKSGDP